MAFAHSPQAEDESKFPCVQVCLIRVRNDRRIKQRCRFYGIFSREIGAQDESAVL